MKCNPENDEHTEECIKSNKANCILMPDTFTCFDCGQIKPVLTNGGTGYAEYDSNKVCYACCALRDKEYMRQNGKIILYLSEEITPADGLQYHVTNWPSTLKFIPYAITNGKHNIARSRTDVWFKFEGFVWHGVQYGDNTQILHCAKTKLKDLGANIAL